MPTANSPGRPVCCVAGSASGARCAHGKRGVCPLRGLWFPAQALCSFGLHLGSAQSQDQAGPLGSQCRPLAAPEPGRTHASSSGLPASSRPSVRPIALSLVPNACRDRCHWFSPSLLCLSCCCPGLTRNHKAANLQEPPCPPESTWFHSPHVLHLY